jgi:hypothetical protein
MCSRYNLKIGSKKHSQSRKTFLIFSTASPFPSSQVSPNASPTPGLQNSASGRESTNRSGQTGDDAVRIHIYSKTNDKHTASIYNLASTDSSEDTLENEEGTGGASRVAVSDNGK